MSKNECGKTRDVDNPYEVWVAGDWEWKVLKQYQSPEKEATNPYARWLCAVKSPYTYGSYDIGDTYIRDIVNVARKVKQLNGNNGIDFRIILITTLEFMGLILFYHFVLILYYYFTAKNKKK